MVSGSQVIFFSVVVAVATDRCHTVVATVAVTAATTVIQLPSLRCTTADAIVMLLLHAVTAVSAIAQSPPLPPFVPPLPLCSHCCCHHCALAATATIAQFLLWGSSLLLRSRRCHCTVAATMQLLPLLPSCRSCRHAKSLLPLQLRSCRHPTVAITAATMPRWPLPSCHCCCHRHCTVTAIATI